LTTRATAIGETLGRNVLRLIDGAKRWFGVDKVGDRRRRLMGLAGLWHMLAGMTMVSASSCDAFDANSITTMPRSSPQTEAPPAPSNRGILSLPKPRGVRE
jgi:hypothetical protein